MYITNKNLQRVMSRISVSSSDIDDFLDENPLLKNILSDKEKENLTAIKYLLQNYNMHLIDTSKYRQVAGYNNTNVVIIGKKSDVPAFHDYLDCAFLNASIDGFEIPKRVIELGEQAVAQYHNFFDKIDSKSQSSEIKGVAIAIQAHYLDKYSIHLSENEILKDIELSNSGATDANNIIKKISQDESNGEEILKKSIESYLNFLSHLQKNNDKKKFYNMRFLELWRLEQIGKKDDDNTLHQLIEEKRKFYENVINYFRFRYAINQESVDEKFLSDIGFRHCGGCIKRRSEKTPSITHNNNYQDTNIPF